MAVYLPILKWKRGEFDALRRLQTHDGVHVVPLLELLDDSIDIEEEEQANQGQGALSSYDHAARQIARCWPTAPCFIDGSVLDVAASSTPHPLEQLFSACRQLGVAAVPVTPLAVSPSYVQAVAAILAIDGRGCAVRVDVDDLVAQNFSGTLTALVASLGAAPANVDLILDWGAIDPTSGAATALAVAGVVPQVPHFTSWRSVVFAASSFPTNLAAVSPGVSSILRAEWAAYKILLAQQPGSRAMSFGDYAIAYPTYAPAPYLGAASIRYTIQDDWLIFRGRSLRGPVYGGFTQFQQLCAQVVAHPDYSGSGFSWGDQYIQQCANGQVSTGNLTTWRTVGTNHHLTFVARQLSSYHAPSTGTAPPPVGP